VRSDDGESNKLGDATMSKPYTLAFDKKKEKEY
jgi:hypothetical protein